jgi:hypothetical protein
LRTALGCGARHIELEDDASLVWDYGPPGSARPIRQPHPITHRAGFLVGFLALADAEPKRILTFAQRWGVLDRCGHRICEHPMCPRRERGPIPKGPGRDDLCWWRTLAAEAGAIFRGASLLRRGERVSREDRQRLVENADPEGFPQSLSGDRALVTAYVNWWADAFAVRPWVFWEGEELDERPTITLPGLTLPGGLAAELLLHLTRTDQLATCDQCGLPYAPARMRRFDRRSFCRKCGHTAALRAASRDYRLRRNAGMQLLSEGSRPSEVATKVGVRPATAKKWAAERRRKRASRNST